jgi:glycerate kinase
MPDEVLVAPDKFKGTYGAEAVAEAIARGVGRAGATASRLPVADGGDGTAEVVRRALGGRRVHIGVQDALGRPVRAGFALLDDGRAVVDVAEASGLGRLAANERDALRASSRGTGELIVAAARAGATEVLVAAGGSACTDAGLGILAALRAARVVLPLTVICDVQVPFERAPAVYGPQKGAGPGEVALLEKRLDRFARGAPRDPRGVPMSGAAGGIAGGLWAYLGADLVPGAPFVLDLLRFDAHLESAAFVITGEGRLDEQTGHGKAVSEVARRAGRAMVPCVALVGEDALGAGAAALGLESVVQAGDRRALEAAAETLILRRRSALSGASR